MVAARTSRAPLFLISGAVALALAAWWRYDAALPSFPVVGEPGTVSMVIYGPARDVDITLLVTDKGHLRIDVLATFDLDEPARPAIPPSRCVQMVVQYSTSSPVPSQTSEICLPQPAAGLSTTRGLGSVLMEVTEPLVVRSGSSTVVRMPRLSPTWFGTDREYEVVYEGAFDRNDQASEDQLKQEAFSPDYRGPGLRWVREQQVANTPGPEPGPYGTFTDVPTEKAASRLLFWAGLLGGGALSLLAWAGDLTLAGRAERRREREHQAEDEAHRREIADLAAQRVLAGLDERLQAAAQRDSWLRRLARWAGHRGRR
ncbi:hypothetical protein F4560_002894 [Saccharothrix ecbatanensis]|uniref:Uncharacterized protein n=1 Tax=Saccharothrix ecbatanensis TaxID=1105145 RepID=A0A7W9M0R8_9PSEU|nr:hypothetical protein [Saccharothrix ecbatanensis]MBB5803126.1 hypothetical protein [Saccharothrix ecbatanensis]